MNAHDEPAPKTVRAAFHELDDRLNAANSALQIVDFLLEKGEIRLAYKATSPVFDALTDMREIVTAAWEDAHKGEDQ